MSTTTPLMTVEELEQIPEDCLRRELWHGELISMSPPGPDHCRISARVCAKLFHYVDEHGLGEVFDNDCRYLLEENPDTLLGADVSFITKKRLPSMRKHRGYFLGPSDLAIEVISPGDRIKTVHAKAREYLTFGTREVWIVNPRDHSITIYSPGEELVELQNADLVSGRPLLPGFECLVSDLIGNMLFDK